MIMTGKQIQSLAVVSDGDDCRVTKIHSQKGWESLKVGFVSVYIKRSVVYINPDGQIMDTVTA